MKEDMFRRALLVAGRFSRPLLKSRLSDEKSMEPALIIRDGSHLTRKKINLTTVDVKAYMITVKEARTDIINI